eukprot:3258530-Amphidinium_carterae.1
MSKVGPGVATRNEAVHSHALFLVLLSNNVNCSLPNCGGPSSVTFGMRPLHIGMVVAWQDVTPLW